MSAFNTTFNLPLVEDIDLLILISLFAFKVRVVALEPVFSIVSLIVMLPSSSPVLAPVAVVVSSVTFVVFKAVEIVSPEIDVPLVLSEPEEVTSILTGSISHVPVLPSFDFVEIFISSSIFTSLPDVSINPPSVEVLDSAFISPEIFAVPP